MRLEYLKGMDLVATGGKDGSIYVVNHKYSNIVAYTKPEEVPLSISILCYNEL